MKKAPFRRTSENSTEPYQNCSTIDICIPKYFQNFPSSFDDLIYAHVKHFQEDYTEVFRARLTVSAKGFRNEFP